MNNSQNIAFWGSAMWKLQVLHKEGEKNKETMIQYVLE